MKLGELVPEAVEDALFDLNATLDAWGSANGVQVELDLREHHLRTVVLQPMSSLRHMKKVERG